MTRAVPSVPDVVYISTEGAIMAKTVIGLIENTSEAEKVVDELMKSGFDREDIGLVSTELLREAAGAVTGATKGIFYGSLAGLLVGVAALAIPGVGTALAAGPATALLSPALGAVAGGLIGGLTSKGVPEDQAHFYAEGLRRGGTLITVNAKDDALAMRAVDILKRHGAIDLDERAREWMQQGWGRRYQETQPEPAKPVQSQQAATASQRPAQAARGPAGEQSSFPAAQAQGAQPVEAQGATHDAGQRSAADQPAVAVSAVEVYSFTLEPGPERRQAA
jgi:hypothetical protein